MLPTSSRQLNVAAGVLLHVLLMGSLPFQGNSNHKILSETDLLHSSRLVNSGSLHANDPSNGAL